MSSTQRYQFHLHLPQQSQSTSLNIRTSAWVSGLQLSPSTPPRTIFVLSIELAAAALHHLLNPYSILPIISNCITPGSMDANDIGQASASSSGNQGEIPSMKKGTQKMQRHKNEHRMACPYTKRYEDYDWITPVIQSVICSQNNAHIFSLDRGRRRRQRAVVNETKG